MITILTGSAAVLFIAGICFIVKALKEEESVIPISSHDEIVKLKNVYESAQKRIASEIESKIEKQSLEMDEQKEQLVKKVGENVMSEVLVEDEEKKELKWNNELLAKQIITQKEKICELEQIAKVLKVEYERLQLEQEKVSGLEEKLKEQQDKNVELVEKEKMVERLKSERDSLRCAYEENQSKQEEKDAEINVLKEERMKWNDEKEEHQKKMDDLNAGFKIREAEFAKKLESIQSVIDSITAQKNETLRVELEALGNKIAMSISTITMLKKENKKLVEEKLLMESEFVEFKEYNNHLLEKEKMMQYELTKNRAQALGLEKICAGFKVKIEEMAVIPSS